MFSFFFYEKWDIQIDATQCVAYYRYLCILIYFLNKNVAASYNLIPESALLHGRSSVKERFEIVIK